MLSDARPSPVTLCDADFDCGDVDSQLDVSEHGVDGGDDDVDFFMLKSTTPL
jgi:hypothetical protein